MSKKSFVNLLLTVVAGMTFALGMCMCLVPEWNLFKPGVVVTGIGLTALAVIGVMAWIRAGKPTAKINWAVTGKIVYGVASALVLGVGMCMIMVFDGMMLLGIIVGMVGIVMLVCMIPVFKGLK